MNEIMIFEPDPTARAVLETALKAEGLEGVAVTEKMPAKAPKGAALLCLYAEGETINPPAGTPESHVFKKPFRLGRLLDLVRRLQKPEATQQDFPAVGPYNLDAANNLLLPRGGKEQVRLTEKETGILKFLHAGKGKSVSREELLYGVWGYVDGVETHTLETHIYRLRQKIEKNAAAPEILLTDESGYRLRL